VKGKTKILSLGVFPHHSGKLTKKGKSKFAIGLKVPDVWRLLGYAPPPE
jgi:hypothetical protein